tara:strand:+ start:334 stop:558 length:225 start_codon:yes stop_codon:yes gene_type:complete
MEYLVALVVAIVFAIIKFFEIRFLVKDELILKRYVIDIILVYFSVLIGTFIISQFSDKAKNLMAAPVFVDVPKF